MLPERNRKKLEKAVSKWERVIRGDGKKALKLRTLMNCAGYTKRGKTNLNLIKQYLHEKGLHLTPPVYQCNRIEEMRLDDLIHIYPYPAGARGRLFEKEAELQEAFVEGYKHPKLGLAEIIREGYKPSGSTKRLDLLCDGADGWKVVVELKNSDGERRVVEQLLTYIGDIKREKGTAEVRGILITGTADPDTLHAVFGLDKENLITWYRYWKTEKDALELEEITKATVKDYISRIETFAA